MEFSDILNNYFELLDCSSKDLATVSEISTSTISRYRSGERVPTFESKQFNSLIEGIEKIAKENNIEDINIDKIKNDFAKTYGKNTIDFNIIRKNLNRLISSLNINISKLARDIGFDASYISRINSGQRKPSNAEEFINSVCNYVVKSYSKEDSKIIVAKLMDIRVAQIQEKEDYLKKLQNWIFLNQFEVETPASSFLKKLDEFKLNEYIKAVHFDKLKIPSIPFYHVPNKTYYGLEEMKDAELDFFKATVMSKTDNSIFMYNDMPMEDMAKDVEFSKKWMFAIACMLKKGLHLNMIHNLDRPFNELMLGLESWIPIYMTGQISPYYFKLPTNNVFSHTLYVSDVAALSGDGLKDYHNKSKYYLTNKKRELEYYQEKASYLLKKATPLMDIYGEKDKKDFNRFMDTEKSDKQNVIYEISNENLNNTFKNINFTICKNKWVIVSKKTNPEINFVIHHPTLRDAIENFIAPMSDNKSKKQ